MRARSHGSAPRPQSQRGRTAGDNGEGDSDRLHAADALVRSYRSERSRTIVTWLFPVIAIPCAVFAMFTACHFLDAALGWSKGNASLAEALQSWITPDASQSAILLSGVGECIALALSLIVTASFIVLNISATSFMPHITSLFFRDRVNIAILAIFVSSNLYVQWAALLSSGAAEPGAKPVVALLLLTVTLSLLFPYFDYLFGFLFPKKLIRRIQGNAIRASASFPTTRPAGEHRRLLQLGRVLPSVLRMNTSGLAPTSAEVERLADCGLTALKNHDLRNTLNALASLGAFMSYFQTRVKPNLPQEWFSVSTAACRTPDFQALSRSSIARLERNRTVIEWKILKKYQMLFEEALHTTTDACFLTAINSRQIGEVAAASNDEAALDLAIKFFNTFMRAAINSNAVRVAYIVLHQYRLLAENLLIQKPKQGQKRTALRTSVTVLFDAQAGSVPQRTSARAVRLPVQKAQRRAESVAWYLRYYATICIEKGLNFIAEIIAHDISELARIAFLHRCPCHEGILKILLTVDDIAEKHNEEVTLRGIRRAQIRLATIFLRYNRNDLCSEIQRDMMHEPASRLSVIRREMESVETKEFWEVSERGANVDYLSPEEHDYLSTFFAFFPGMNDPNTPRSQRAFSVATTLAPTFRRGIRRMPSELHVVVQVAGPERGKDCAPTDAARPPELGCNGTQEQTSLPNTASMARTVTETEGMDERVRSGNGNVVDEPQARGAGVPWKKAAAAHFQEHTFALDVTPEGRADVTQDDVVPAWQYSSTPANSVVGSHASSRRRGSESASPLHKSASHRGTPWQLSNAVRNPRIIMASTQLPRTDIARIIGIPILIGTTILGMALAFDLTAQARDALRVLGDSRPLEPFRMINSTAARSLANNIAVALATYTTLLYTVSIIMVQISVSRYLPHVSSLFFQDTRISIFLQALIVNNVFVMLVSYSTSALYVPRTALLLACILASFTILAIIPFFMHLFNFLHPERIVFRIASQAYDSVSSMPSRHDVANQSLLELKSTVTGSPLTQKGDARRNDPLARTEKTPALLGISTGEASVDESSAYCGRSRKDDRARTKEERKAVDTFHRIMRTTDLLADFCLNSLESTDKFNAFNCTEALALVVLTAHNKQRSGSRDVPVPESEISRLLSFVGIPDATLSELARTSTWLEWKVLQQYRSFLACALKKGNRDQCTLLATNARLFGESAADTSSLQAVRIVCKFFNTFLRMAINHRDTATVGSLSQEYAGLAAYLLRHRSVLRDHGTDISRSQLQPFPSTALSSVSDESLVPQLQLVSGITGALRYYAQLGLDNEMSSVCTLIAHDIAGLCEQADECSSPIHDLLLDVLLTIDDMAAASGREYALRGARRAQIKLATLYMANGKQQLARVVYADMKNEPVWRLLSLRREMLSVERAEHFEMNDRVVHLDYLVPSRRKYIPAFFCWFRALQRAPELSAGEPERPLLSTTLEALRSASRVGLPQGSHESEIPERQQQQQQQPQAATHHLLLSKEFSFSLNTLGASSASDAQRVTRWGSQTPPGTPLSMEAAVAPFTEPPIHKTVDLQAIRGETPLSRSLAHSGKMGSTIHTTSKSAARVASVPSGRKTFLGQGGHAVSVGKMAWIILVPFLLVPLLVLSTALCAYLIDSQRFGTNLVQFTENLTEPSGSTVFATAGLFYELMAATLSTVLMASLIALQISATRTMSHTVDFFFSDVIVLTILLTMVASNAISLWTAVFSSVLAVPAWLLGMSYSLLLLNAMLIIPYFGYLFNFLDSERIAQRSSNVMLEQAKKAALSGREGQVSIQQLRLSSQIERLADFGSVAVCGKDKKNAVVTLQCLLKLVDHMLAIKPRVCAAWLNVKDNTTLHYQPDFIILRPAVLASLSDDSVWLEWKVLRQFLSLFEESHRNLKDLCYLISIYTRQVGELALDAQELRVLDLVVRFFNTFVRLTLREKDVRTVYHVLHQYRDLAAIILQRGAREADVPAQGSTADVSGRALQIAECIRFYAIVALEGKMPFIVEIIAHDLEKLVETAHSANSSVHEQLLSVCLSMSEITKDHDEDAMRRGIRRAQIKMAAYYMEKSSFENAVVVLAECLSEDEERLESIVNEMLAIDSPEFWEENERGINVDFVNAQHKQHVSRFLNAFLHAKAQGSIDKSMLYASAPVPKAWKSAVSQPRASLYDESPRVNTVGLDGATRATSLPSPVRQRFQREDAMPSHMVMPDYSSGDGPMRGRAMSLAVVEMSKWTEIDPAASVTQKALRSARQIVLLAALPLCALALLLISVLLDSYADSATDASTVTSIFGDLETTAFRSAIASGIGKVAASTLGIVITTSLIVLQISATSPKFLGHAAQMFFRDRFMYAILAFFITGNAITGWMNFSVREQSLAWSPSMLVVSTAFNAIALVILYPYFQYIFNFMNPGKVIDRLIQREMRDFAELKRLSTDEFFASRQQESVRTLQRLSDFGLRALQGKDRYNAANAVQSMCRYMLFYSAEKQSLPMRWFVPCDVLHLSPDFLSLSPEMREILAQNKTWLEWKVFKQWLVFFVEAFDHVRDVCYSIAINTRRVGEVCSGRGDAGVLDLAIRFFNTYLRFSINQNDIRTAYNILHQYRQLGEALLHQHASTDDNVDRALDRQKRCVQVAAYLRYYALICLDRGLYFLAEIIAHDIAGLCSTAFGLNLPCHGELLSIFLTVDDIAEGRGEEVTLRGVRRAQIKLATVYLLRGHPEHARLIYEDLLVEPISRLLIVYRELIQIEDEEFWEISDRGTNVDYLTPHQKRILDRFFAWFEPQGITDEMLRDIRSELVAKSRQEQVDKLISKNSARETRESLLIVQPEIRAGAVRAVSASPQPTPKPQSDEARYVSTQFEISGTTERTQASATLRSFINSSVEPHPSRNADSRAPAQNQLHRRQVATKHVENNPTVPAETTGDDTQGAGLADEISQFFRWFPLVFVSMLVIAALFFVNNGTLHSPMWEVELSEEAQTDTVARMTLIAVISATSLGFIITASIIIIQISAHRFTPHITVIFLKDKRMLMAIWTATMLSIFSLLALAQLSTVRAPALLFVGETALSMILLLLFPYFSYLFDFLNPLKVIAKFHDAALRSVQTVFVLPRKIAGKRDSGAFDTFIDRHQLATVEEIERIGDFGLSTLQLKDKDNTFAAVRMLGTLCIKYLDCKSLLPQEWFRLHGLVRQCPDFINLSETAIERLNKRHTWIEYKILRQFQMLFGVSLAVLRDTCFTISVATLDIARSTVRHGSAPALDLCICFFNTYIRFAINARDMRTAYNVLNQYRELGELLLRGKEHGKGAMSRIAQERFAVTIATHMRYYALICLELRMLFLVEIIAHDIGTLCDLAHESHSSVHSELLSLFLTVDDIAERQGEELTLRGIRRAQIKLATTYLIRGESGRAAEIYSDMEAEPISRMASIWLELLNVGSLEFWEVNDRGINVDYLSLEQKAQLPEFFRFFPDLAALDTFDQMCKATLASSSVELESNYAQLQGKCDSTAYTPMATFGVTFEVAKNLKHSRVRKNMQKVARDAEQSAPEESTARPCSTPERQASTAEAVHTVEPSAESGNRTDDIRGDATDRILPVDES